MRRLGAVAAVITLLAAGEARAQWSAPQTVSQQHTYISGLFAGPGPWFAYPWTDGTDREREGGSVRLGARERSAMPGLVAAARYGDRQIALAQRRPARTDESSRQRLSYSDTRAGRAFDHPVTITTAGIVAQASMSVSERGAALVAWCQYVGREPRLMAVHRPAGARRFGRPQVLAGTGRSTLVHTAVGADGTLAVVAVRDQNVVARVSPRGRGWGKLQTLARRPGSRSEYDIGVGIGGGEILASWRRVQDGRLQTATAPLARPVFAAPVTLAERVDEGIVEPIRSGWAALYSDQDHHGFVAIRPRGGAFGAAKEVGQTGSRSMRQLRLAESADGERLAAGWIAQSGDRLDAQVALGTPGGAFAAPASIAPGERAGELALLAHGGGFLAAYSGLTGDGAEVRLRTHP